MCVITMIFINYCFYLLFIYFFHKLFFVLFFVIIHIIKMVFTGNKAFQILVCDMFFTVRCLILMSGCRGDVYKSSYTYLKSLAFMSSFKCVTVTVYIYSNLGTFTSIFDVRKVRSGLPVAGCRFSCRLPIQMPIQLPVADSDADSNADSVAGCRFSCRFGLRYRTLI